MSALYPMTLRTSVSIETVEKVAAASCHRTYSLSLGGFDDTAGVVRKIIKFNFQSENDRSRFRRNFSGLGKSFFLTELTEAQPGANPWLYSAKYRAPTAKSPG